jgi:hypothetical protein
MNVGFKTIETAASILSGVEVMHMIKKVLKDCNFYTFPYFP